MSITPTAVIEPHVDQPTPAISSGLNGHSLEPITEEQFGPLSPELWPNIDHIITEDDAPVDNIGSEKQQRMLAHILFGWAGPGAGRSFAAFANVGLYYSLYEPPLVPDVMVSLDVQLKPDLWQKKQNRTYLMWEHGKPPDVVIEIVSNKVGKEGDLKKDKYAQIGIKYYVIYDPAQQLSKAMLRLYELRSTGYEEMSTRWLAGVGLGLTFWQGKFEDVETTWLRWCDEQGKLLLTGDERATQAQQEATRAQEEAAQAQQEAARAQEEAAQAQHRAQQAEAKADQERLARAATQQQLDLLLAQLRALGIEPPSTTTSSSKP